MVIGGNTVGVAERPPHTLSSSDKLMIELDFQYWMEQQAEGINRTYISNVLIDYAGDLELNNMNNVVFDNCTIKCNSLLINNCNDTLFIDCIIDLSSGGININGGCNHRIIGNYVYT